MLLFPLVANVHFISTARSFAERDGGFSLVSSSVGRTT
jgi:hypothetical protein